MACLLLEAPHGVPEVARGCDLAGLVLQACVRIGWAIADGDCFVLAQKIVSKAEGRDVRLDEVLPGARALALAEVVGKDARLVELVLRESVRVVRAAPGLLITEHRLGHVLANAGVDQSNVPGADGERALLLPEDPDRSARAIARSIAQRCGVRVAVLINDSFGRVWREGVCGTAIGVYGRPAVIDRRGVADRNGRALQVTRIGHADEVAAAASLLMGQADKGRPLVCVRGLGFDAGEAGQAGMAPVHRPAQMDLFR